MAQLRLFAQARVVAGRGDDVFPGDTVAAVLASAVSRYGPAFDEVLAVSAVWVNGEPARAGDVVVDTDEVAVLPPVSGGA